MEGSAGEGAQAPVGWATNPDLPKAVQIALDGLVKLTQEGDPQLRFEAARAILDFARRP